MSSQLIAASNHLARVDRQLAPVIRRVGPCGLKRRTKHLFDSIASAIVSQQLSDKASSAIELRIAQQCGITRPYQPHAVLKHTAESLRGAGLSTAKAKYILNIAELVQNDRLQLEGLRKLPANDAIARLCELPGVGVWTAEMFLIFGLGFLDVFSVGDAGLRRAIRNLYGLAPDSADEAYASLAERWSPYRSVACWYLWRTLD